jgi:hypothetical protein
MKLKLSASVIAIAAMAGTGSFAADTSTFDAAISVLSPDQTGFIIGGQVAVTGLGSGALTMSRSAAEMSVLGGAVSELDPAAGGYLDGVNSGSDITSSLTFDREISTSGSLVGQGSVTARGEAIASMGTAGAASADTATAGTRADGNIAGGEGSATASSSSQGSLNGSVSTANTLQLLGTSGLFAGSNALTVGELNQAIAAGSAFVAADGTSGIDLTDAEIDYNGGDLPDAYYNNDGGAVFGVLSTLTNNNADIAMSVSNAGNGTISLTTSTGGFFTGGGAAAGSATHVDSGSFFSPDL